MTSTNDGKDVKSNQISGHKGKSYYIELYKTLEKALSGENSLEARTAHVCEAWRRVYSLYQHSAASTHPHLLSWLQRHTAHTVLQSKWADCKNEHARLTTAIDALVAEATAASTGRDQHPWEQLLLQRAAWFRKTLSNPWGHPVLKSLIDPNGEPVTDQQVLEWLVEERGIVLVTRLRQLVSAGNCDDLALLLASAVMDRARAAVPHRPDEHADDKVEEQEDTTSFVAVLEREASFTVDVWELLTDIELVLLLKTDKRPRCIELAKLAPLRHGYAMVERLRNRLATSPRDKKLWKHAKEVATLVTQVVIARCMVLSTCTGVGRAALYCCARSLARLVPSAKLPAVSSTLAKPAHTARHLHTFCAALDAQCSEDMKPFICELYVRAITTGMNELEQFKLNADKATEARSMEQTLASWFTQLGALLAASARLRAECALTAFSVHPARAHYERVAALPPPARLQVQEPTPESKDTASEFGSWANDSRTQSNLVKTSETLQLKKTDQHQANVLSTAILTEGETLGLEPVLCQDLAVLLSGPRVKTLSWDMDRDILLKNCRTYMERTDGGTRAVTTELKYLNLDPNAYRHLPEEGDDESDIYYGIEKGYEHEVQLEDPEEIWQNAFFDPEQTESANDSEVDQVSKRKVKASVFSSDDDEDPLSTIADAKKEKKKLAKEKNKEQRRKKSHKRDTSKDGSRERRKDKDKKTKKESKKDKSEQPATGSLTSLLGMKVSKMPSQVQDGQKKVRKKKERRRDSMFSYVSVNDNDYDSHEKSLISVSDPNILVDGVFSMDELKSPERQSEDSQKPIDNTKTTLTKSDSVQSPVINDIKSRPRASSAKVTTSDDSDVNRAKSPYLTPNQLLNKHVVSGKVKTSIISKLLQFRRKKAQIKEPPKSSAPNQTQGVSDRSTPNHLLVGMKIYNSEEIPKVYTSKKQQLETIKNEVNNLPNVANEGSSNNVNYMHKIPNNAPADHKLQNTRLFNINVQKPSRPHINSTHDMSQNVFTESPNINSEYVQHNTIKCVPQTGYMKSPTTPSVIHTNYVSPTKQDIKSHALNLTPPKSTIAHQPFHKSMQNLSTGNNIMHDVPKKPLLINDPNYFSQQNTKSVSQLSPRIISNTCIKPPITTATSCQQIATAVNAVKDEIIKSSQRYSELNRMNMYKGRVQNLSAEIANLKSDFIKYGQKQLSSSMHNVNETLGSSSDVTERHIPTPNDMLHGKVSRSKPCSGKPNTFPAYYANNSSSTSQCSSVQNQERVDAKIQKKVQTPKPVIGLNSHYQDFLKELAKTINAGSSGQNKNVSIALNKEVKVTPVLTPSTQCAKQTIQHKKTEIAPNTFSRLSYMHKNKQNDNKVNINDAMSMELNKKIMDHKISKAKFMNNEVTISRVGVTNPNAQDRGNVVRVNQQTSSKLQKTCPVLSSMLDSPIKENSQTCNLATTSQSSFETQTDREHADLLLLLRNQPILKTNCNTSATLTSDSTLTQTLNNTQTKLDTAAHQTLVGTKVKNINTFLGTTAPVKKESTPEDNKPQEWKRVMNAILAHKTEPLGPNALDMVLKNDYKRHSHSSSRLHASHKSNKMTGHTPPQNKSSELKKREQNSSIKSLSSRKPSTEKHSEVPKRHRQNEIIKKTSSTETHKKPEVQNKLFCSNPSKNDDAFISGIPNSAYDMLGDLMDDDLRQELGELSSDEEAYSAPNVPITILKNNTNIPKTGTTYKITTITKENSHIVAPKTILCKDETTSSLVDTNRCTAMNTQSATGYTNLIRNNSSHIDSTRLLESRPTVVCSNTERPHTATVITNQIVQHTAADNVITNHNNIDPNCFMSNIEPANLIIASLPVPAQPVVVIRQDLVYDPYPTIRIHESQVTAGLCSVNQNVYSINSAPNIAVYQTTQFAAPVINSVFIGNAMTTTNVSNAIAMRDQQVAPDSTNANEKTNSVNSEVANRLTKDDMTSEKQTSLDFNMNKNCERRVLSQVQEKQPTENLEKDTLIRRCSVDDKPVKTKEDEERIKQKRQSLLNRKISHACFHPPIPLTYTPLRKKVNLEKLLQQETPKNGTVKPNPRLMPSNGINKYVSVTTSVKNAEANNENIESTEQVSNAKENQKTCRISLRSSKIIHNKVSCDKQTKIRLNRNKIKLKVTDLVIEKLTNLENENKDGIKPPTRSSSRILNKNKPGPVSSKPVKPEETQNSVENNELIDFEEELSGSKILKTSVTKPNTDEASEQELKSNTIADDIKPENIKSIAKEHDKLESNKDTTPISKPKQLINNSLEPTVLIEKLKANLGDRLLIKSMPVKAPGKDQKVVSIENLNRIKLRSKSITNDCVTPQESCTSSNKMKEVSKYAGTAKSASNIVPDKTNKLKPILTDEQKAVKQIPIASPIAVFDKTKVNPTTVIEQKKVKGTEITTDLFATTQQTYGKDLPLCAKVLQEFKVINKHSPMLTNEAPLTVKKTLPGSEVMAKKVVTRRDASKAIVQKMSNDNSKTTQVTQTIPNVPIKPQLNIVNMNPTRDAQKDSRQVEEQTLNDRNTENLKIVPNKVPLKEANIVVQNVPSLSHEKSIKVNKIIPKPTPVLQPQMLEINSKPARIEQKEGQHVIEETVQTLNESKTSPAAKIVPNVTLKEANTMVQNVWSLANDKSETLNKTPAKITVPLLTTLSASETVPVEVTPKKVSTTVQNMPFLENIKNEKPNKIDPKITVPLLTTLPDSETVPVEVKPKEGDMMVQNTPSMSHEKIEKESKTGRPELRVPIPTTLPVAVTVPIEVKPQEEDMMVQNTSSMPHEKIETERKTDRPKQRVPIPTTVLVSVTVPVEVKPKEGHMMVQNTPSMSHEKIEKESKTDRPKLHVPTPTTLPVSVTVPVEVKPKEGDMMVQNTLSMTHEKIEKESKTDRPKLHVPIPTTVPVPVTVPINVTPKEVNTIVKRATRARIAQTDCQQAIKQLEVNAAQKTQDTEPDIVILKSDSPIEIISKDEQTKVHSVKSPLCDKNKISLSKVIDDVSPQSNENNKRGEHQIANRLPMDLAHVNTVMKKDNIKSMKKPVAKSVPKKNATISNLASGKKGEGLRTITKDDLKIEELPVEGGKNSDKKTVRISLPNGKVFRVTISGNIYTDFDSLFANPTFRSHLAHDIQGTKRYTINCTQTTKKRKDNPSKIDTKTREMVIKEAIDTVNLISDDEEEEEIRSFTTEFGKYRTNVDQQTFTKHQNKFGQKCIVKLCRKNIIDKTNSTSRSSQSVKASLLTRTKSKVLSHATIETNISPKVDCNTKNNDDDLPAVSMKPASTQETFESDNTNSKSSSCQSIKASLLTRTQSTLLSDATIVTNINPEVDSNTINNDDDLPAVSMKSTSTQKTVQPPQLEQTNDTVNIPEVIEIDDSSNDSVEDLITKIDSNENVEPVRKILALKNLLLQDLGVEESNKTEKDTTMPLQNIPVVDDLKDALLQDLGVVTAANSIIDITSNDEEHVTVSTENPTINITPNEHHLKESTEIQNLSIIKDCVVIITKCDNLIKRHEFMKTMKRCYVKLERLNNSDLEKASLDELDDKTNNEETDESNQDDDEDFIEFDVGDTSTSPQLSRYPSLSILNNWDNECQPSPESLYRSSPVMEIYDTIIQLRSKPMGKSGMLRDSDRLFSFFCNAEWRLKKLECRNQEILRLSNIPATEDKEHKVILSDCDNTESDDDILAVTFEVPKLSKIILKFLEDNPGVINQLQSMRKVRRILRTPSNKLKRKTEEGVNNTVSSKLLKLGSLALNTLNSCITVATISIPDSELCITINPIHKCNLVEVTSKHREVMQSVTRDLDFNTRDNHMTANVEDIEEIKQIVESVISTDIESNQSNERCKTEMDMEEQGQYRKPRSTNNIEESLSASKETGYVDKDITSKGTFSYNRIEEFNMTPGCIETKEICKQVPHDLGNVLSYVSIEHSKPTPHEFACAKDDVEEVSTHENTNVANNCIESEIISDNVIDSGEEIPSNSIETTDNRETKTLNETSDNLINTDAENSSPISELQRVEENDALIMKDVIRVVRGGVDNIPDNNSQMEMKVETSIDSLLRCPSSGNKEINQGDVSINISIQETTYSNSVFLNSLETAPNTSDDSMQLDNEKLSNIDTVTQVNTTIETDIDNNEPLEFQAGIDFKLNQEDFVTENALSETNYENEESEDNDKVTSPPLVGRITETSNNATEMSTHVSTEQAVIEALHIDSVANSDQYEIPYAHLFHKVYEVEIGDTHVEDGIDIAKTFSKPNPEPVPVNDVDPLEVHSNGSEIKSPVFIDCKEIANNYHDYTKQPKQKQLNTLIDHTPMYVENRDSDTLNEKSDLKSDVKTADSSLKMYLKPDPCGEATSTDASEMKVNSTDENYPLPKCKYELIQDDDWLTVIKTENDKVNNETSLANVGSNDKLGDKTVVASLSSKNTTIKIKGFEYEDVYVFPLSESSSLGSSNTSSDSLGQELNSDVLKSDIVLDDLHDIDYCVIAPKATYSRKCLKRKIDMKDIKVAGKKYRKGKNIDCPKVTATSVSESAYGKEYKRFLEYCSSVKFSYSRPFHKECVEVDDLTSNWPIISAFSDVSGDFTDEHLFVSLQETDIYQPDPTTQTLAEEISYEYENTNATRRKLSSDASEENLNMGFGEGSGRVIQILKKGGESNISAATLSDVKQSQPVFKSVDFHDFNDFKTNIDDQMNKIRQHVNFIELRDKVRSFFKKSSVELKSDWLQENFKDADFKSRFHVDDFPFDLCSLDYVKPLPTEAIVQVVQVGQLPVSAAAQNPVTCDPRVTQVSDASPSQCSVDNSPNDDSQSEIKTEYTELTTADLTLPLQEYAQQNQAMNLASNDSNVELIEQTISLEMEIKAEESPEIKEEMPDIKEEKSNSSDTELHTLTSATPENVNYSFENNTAKSDTSSVIYDSSEQNSSETTFSQQRHQNGTSEKTDQIAHAMNAAGITTTPETITNTRAHALVNILSQKIRQGTVNNTQTATNTYSKTTSINAMALQQALAQILPPPLNQTGSSENNQTQSTPVGPQVLHIVQGKNASGNQITLVDNSQQSVISTPNATQVLHIVQNKSATPGQASNGTLTPQANSFSGLSLVDAGLQQGGNQLLHIVNTGNQKTASPGQLLKRVNLLTNLTNVQGSNEQKMVQFVCKSADGKAIQLNAPHQRSMVLRLQPIETPTVQTPPAKPAESQELSPSPTCSAASKDSASQQEIKSRSIYEENYAKFIQNSSSKTPSLEKSTSLPKFNQAFGKPVFQEGSQKQGETASNNSHLPPVNRNNENSECPATDNAINLEHIGQISSPPLLLRKQPAVTTQSQPNIVQQIKQTIAPMNIQTMHGGVIYTRQIPVNIGGGQTINLITVPSTELINDETPKPQTQTSQGDIEPSIIKIVPQSQTTTNTESTPEESNNHAVGSNENTPTPQPQPVLTQMRIKLPMLSKAPQMVPGARVVRPSFFQIQRNVIGGANQPVYQQLVLTAAPPLGQQTIRLPQTQTSRPIKVPSESQSSSSEPQMSSSTLEQLREFDMVLEQVKERSTVQPSTNTTSNSSFKIHTSSSDTTDGNGSSNCSTESTPQVLYSIGNNQSLNVAYVNRKTTVTTPTTSTYVRSPDSSGIADSPTSSTHVQIPHTVTTDSPTEMSSQSKPAKLSSKSKSKPKSTSNPPNTLKLNSVPPKTSSQKPLEDEQTTQRILYILAEYKEQVENSPDKDKPAPRRRSNPPSNPGSSKRKKSSGSRRSGTRDMSPVHGEDTCRTMGSEDSSCGTSQGDCTESCLDSHSPQDSPRKVVRKITFDQELTVTQPRPQPQRNVIVADGQTITVARGTTGKPTTAVLMPANYILPVSMVKGGQQIAIVTNRGPKLLTVGGEGGATNALLLQRLIGPAGLKPVLARPGVRHVRLPTAALHNLQAFNLATATTVQPPDSTASPTPGPTPPELADTRATSSPWTERDDVKPERGSSPEGSEPWNLPSSADAHDYTYEETVRTDNMDRTVLVVQKKDGSQRQHRLSHVSAAALRHKYAILEHELRLQKSLSEECEDLGVDSPSASELFPEAELLFAASPAHEHNQDAHHSHTPQPLQSSIPQPDMDDQIATDHLIPREIDVSLGLGDVGIVAVSEDGMQATIALDQEEFARSHPNTTFHSEPTEGEVQPFTITGLKGRHITSTIFHSNSAPATVLMAAPQATVISQAPDHGVKYEIENMINSMPSSHNNDINLSSVLVKDDGLTRFDNILTDSRELHLSNTASAIVHSSGNATQVIRRVCYEDDKRERDTRYLIDEPDNLIAGDDAKMIAEDSSRDATLESMADVDDDRSSPERHAELFWESNSASERSESRRPLDFSSDSDKCCKSPSFDETNSTDSSGVGTHMRLDSVIKEARGRERSGSADGSSADDTHPPLRTYPPKRLYHPLEGEVERSLSGKTRAGERSPDSLEVRRRASGRGVVKRGCHCCNGSPAPPRPKKPRQRKPTLDFNTNT